MNTLESGLNYLLEKYNIEGNGNISGEDLTVSPGKGETVHLLPWRIKRKFIELKNLILNKTVNNISVIRISHIAHKDTPLEDLIYREADLCRWFLDSEVKTVFSVANKNTANIIMTMENDVVCTLELSAVLEKNREEIDKHEIITGQGVACDRVVDTQIPQHSIYMFTEEAKTYTDVDYELFGYSSSEIALIRQSFEVIKDNELGKILNSEHEKLKKIVEIIKKSGEQSKSLAIKEEIRI